MTIFHHIAPCALSIFLGLASTLFPLNNNVFATDSSSPPECKDGYEYIESVGKCYKKCAEGWARNSETNRCRKIRDSETSSPSPDSAFSEAPASSSPSTEDSSAKTNPDSDSPASASTLPSCKDGYEYVESAGKCYKACAEDQERNPETNRCRKIQTDDESTKGSADTDTKTSSKPTLKNENLSTSADSETNQKSNTSASTSAPPSCKDGYEYVASAGKCYKACAENQERNPETNRCRKIVAEDDDTSATSSSTNTGSTSSTNCKEGYEYVASAGKCYKACLDGQIRNPETNRCKKESTETSSNKECEEGYVRNPETNRCRKIKNNDGADYDVDVPETGGQSSFIAIGAVIALVLAGLGFVIFQYRQEILRFLKKHLKNPKKSA